MADVMLRSPTRPRRLLGTLAVGVFVASACGGSSKVRHESHESASGGTAARGGSGGRSGTGGTTPSTGGGVVCAGSGGAAGAPLGGGGGTAGERCAAERVPTSEFCPVSGAGCPLALDAARHVDAICELDGEDGHYSVCSSGYSRLEWLVGFGEISYDLVFSTAAGELVSGDARVYDDACGTLVTKAGSPPSLGTCRTCAFCPSGIEETAGAGGDAGAGSGDRCVFDSERRVTLP